VKLAVVLLQIISNGYKEEHNLIGISCKVSVFLLLLYPPLPKNDNSIPQTAAPLVVVDILCGVTAAVRPQLSNILGL